LRIVLAGFGVVGQSFAELLVLKSADLASRYGVVPRLVAIVDSEGSVLDGRGLSIKKALQEKRTKGRVGDRNGRDTARIIAETEAEVLIEATPTNFRTGEPGLSHMKAAFASKKHVVTCNKGPLAVAFHAMHELARHNGVQLRYSGAVGGGTPILDFGQSCARGDDIVSVTGILNGTCNFILSKMEQDGATFDDALKLAQKEGYAEADPTLDIDGYDSAVKLVIMANHLGLSRATVKEVKIKGIRGIDSREVVRARESGRAIRLIATAEHGLSISPTSLDRNDPVCVSGAYNAVKFHCRFSGPKVIIGKGAGGPETASSLLRDLLDIRGAFNEGVTA
jgi:homoserine dehydrogenase